VAAKSTKSPTQQENEDEEVYIMRPTVITDKFIAEEVWDRSGAPEYCVRYFGQDDFKRVGALESRQTDDKGRRIIFVPVDNDHLRKGLVIVPQWPKPSSFDKVYEAGCDLSFKIYDCEPKKLPSFRLNIAVAQGSWFLDRFYSNPKMIVAGMGRFSPIIAYRGPSGSGKNRALNATRLNSYRPFFDQSTKRVPSLFRPLDLWGGTLCIDECDLGHSHESADVTHYLNCRAYGTPVARQNPESPGRGDAFNNFGLTEVTQRRAWNDDATEDRSLPYYCEKSQRDLATTELDEWIIEGLDLQNQLLYLRLMFWDKVRIDKAARIPGVKDHRLTASVLPLLALKSEAPLMVENLAALLLELEKKRREVKARSKDGTITNALWDHVSEGEIGTHNGDWFVGKSMAKTNAASSIVPLTTTDLAEALKWKSPQVRTVINSLNLFDGGGVRDVAKIGGKSYRPIWFSEDHFDSRLQDFVVEYEAGDLAKAIQKVTEVTQVTDYGTGRVAGVEGEPNEGTVARGVTSVTSVTGSVKVDERFENIELLHPHFKRGLQTPTEPEPDDVPSTASEGSQAIRFVCAGDGECDYVTTIRGEAESHAHGTVLINLSPKLAAPPELENLGDGDPADDHQPPIVKQGALRIDLALVEDFLTHTALPQQEARTGYGTEPTLSYAVRSRFGDAAAQYARGLLLDMKRRGIVSDDNGRLRLAKK